jgi:hypothetical protein
LRLLLRALLYGTAKLLSLASSELNPRVVGMAVYSISLEGFSAKDPQQSEYAI